jgi:hypothetical protein
MCTKRFFHEEREMSFEHVFPFITTHINPIPLSIKRKWYIILNSANSELSLWGTQETDRQFPGYQRHGTEGKANIVWNVGVEVLTAAIMENSIVCDVT